MSMENLKIEQEITDEQVTSLLRERLEKIESDLAEQKIEETDTTGEDDIEIREARSEQEPMRDILVAEKEMVQEKIKWVKENGDACVALNCSNKVPAGRRENLGVTCALHMDQEEEILKERKATQ